eukprot:TRINITY_DN2900_c1_g1_i1.p1 TRINITY_DN2900_c1_g1~~TRINITY_DN2900_c1_g1_i1.p1  ORF type:complete len:1079 (-),score=306.06 TRINITY_DN2900_c1_g1_i1:91-3216(-)
MARSNVRQQLETLQLGDRVRVPTGLQIRTDKFSAGMEGVVCENRPDPGNCLVCFDKDVTVVGYRYLEPLKIRSLPKMEVKAVDSGMQREPVPPTAPRPGSGALRPSGRGRGLTSLAAEGADVATLRSMLKRMEDELKSAQGEALKLREQTEKQAAELEQMRVKLRTREEQMVKLVTAADAARSASNQYNALLDSLLGKESAVKASNMLDNEAASHPSKPVYTPDQVLPSLPTPAQDSGPGWPAAQPAQETKDAGVVGQQQPAAAAEAAVEDGQSEEESDDDVGALLVQEMTQRKTLSKEELMKLGVDLDRRIGWDEWQFILRELDIDEDEGKGMHERVQADFASKGESDGDGFPLSCYLLELHINLSDRESVEAIGRAAHAAKDNLERLRAQKLAAGGAGATLTMFNKIVRALDFGSFKAEDSWKLVSDGKVALSKVEQEHLKVWKGQEKQFVEKVKHFMLEAPVVNANAGQTLCNEQCIAEVDAIIKRCKAEGTQYTDPDWDFQLSPEECLYVDRSSPGWDCTVARPTKFRRLPAIVKSSSSSSSTSAVSSLFGGFSSSSASKAPKKPLLFKGGVKAGDIVQGQIGTCYLLGAMGAIAAHGEDMIEKLFVRYDVDVGVYGIRFCIDGEWTYVIIDDLMPVDESGGLLYARCQDPQEVWVPLLEKAFCKAHTCYEMCDGGESSEAVFALLGGVGGKFKIKGQYKRFPEKYFHLLQGAREKGWLLTTGFQNPGDDAAVLSGKCGEAVLSSGLTEGHAYSVLGVVEACGNQLVCCRNPWGTGEWQGMWSDNNAYQEWTPQMKKATGYLGLDDGMFWMSVEDFVQHSTGVEYSRTFGPNWKKCTQYAKFQKRKVMATATKDHWPKRTDELSFSAGDQIEIKDFVSNYWFGQLANSEEEGYFPGNFVEVNDRPVARFDLVGTRFKTASQMTVVVMLMQPNVYRERKFYKRREDGQNYKDTRYAHVQLIVIHPDGSVACKKEGQERCVWTELILPGGGLWKIYALSRDGSGNRFSLRVYVKDGSVSLKEVPGSTFAECVAALEGNA